MVDSEALIYKKGNFAAKLLRTSRGVRFEYERAYLESGLPAIATSLPLSAESITLQNGATPAFFAGLLPEGPRLIAMKNRIKASLNDELSLLLEIGQDLVGDVQVLLKGVNPSLDRESLSLALTGSDFSFKQIRQAHYGSRASGIPGVQDKVSSKMLNAPVRSANIDYILKLNPDSVPFAVQNESFFLGLANQCGIETAKFKMLADSEGEHALRLKRFDRISSGAIKLRLAAEDGCQVLNQYPSEKYNQDFITVATKLISLCPARAVAGLTLFKQLVFSWLIGNGDAHAKNYSILETPSGEWRISPAYDLLCTRYYQDREMALPINEQVTGWSRQLLVEAASKIQVPEKAAQKVITKQLLVLDNLSKTIIDGALPFESHANYEVAKFLKKRAERLA